MILQVSREYYILNDVQRHDGFPAPKPIYESSASDVKIVGTRFIVMEFVSVSLQYYCMHNDHNIIIHHCMQLYVCMCVGVCIHMHVLVYM